MDGGFDNRNAQGLSSKNTGMTGYILKNLEDSLANVPSQKGIFYSEPLIANWAAEIRWERENESAADQNMIPNGGGH